MFQMVGAIMFAVLGFSFLPALFRIIVVGWPIVIVATLYGYFVLGITCEEEVKQRS